MRPVPVYGARIQACESCGTTLLILDGVTLGVGEDTMAKLARFGLGLSSEPLLKPEESSD